MRYWKKHKYEFGFLFIILVGFMIEGGTDLICRALFGM